MPTTKAKRALLLLADGAEEMETVIPVDVLRRAGVRVTVAGLAGSGPVTCSRGVRLLPDASLEEALAAGWRGDLLLLPGGLGGAQALAASARVLALLKECHAAGLLIGAICAGPTVLAGAGLLAGRRFTSHPAVREQLAGQGAYVAERVVRDGTLITSQGPGTSISFALALVEALLGREMAAKVAGPMLVEGW